MNGGRFEWDSRKGLENQEKHEVSFFEAQYAFADSFRVIVRICLTATRKNAITALDGSVAESSPCGSRIEAE